LKALVSHFLGMPLELMSRLAIAPASITVLDIDRWGACLRCLGAESVSPIDV
jgi:probable phosphoglycerate mutase